MNQLKWRLRHFLFPREAGHNPGYCISTTVTASAGGYEHGTTTPDGAGFLDEAMAAPGDGIASVERRWVNPTDGEVRGCDAKGCGNFGASRDGGRRRHLGVDYVGSPGQGVVAVTSGTVDKIGFPYGDDLSYRYVRIKTTDGYVVRELYVLPSDGIRVGTEVTAGQQIGTLQSLQTRYSGITDHVHIDIGRGGVPVNPETLIGR